jgi:hypothetical protein
MQSGEVLEDNDFGDKSAFDFDEMVRQARIGYTELASRRDSLKESIVSANLEMERIASQLEKLGAMLKSLGVQPEDSLARPRPPVASLTEAAVNLLFTDNQDAVLREADIVAEVRKTSPSVKDKSIQNALYRMDQAGKITRLGKRGAYSYSMPGSQTFLVGSFPSE